MNLRFADANENYGGGKGSEQERSDCFNVETHNSSPGSRFAPVLKVTVVYFHRSLWRSALGSSELRIGIAVAKKKGGALGETPQQMNRTKGS